MSFLETASVYAPRRAHRPAEIRVERTAARAVRLPASSPELYLIVGQCAVIGVATAIALAVTFILPL